MYSLKNIKIKGFSLGVFIYQYEDCYLKLESLTSAMSKTNLKTDLETFEFCYDDISGTLGEKEVSDLLLSYGMKVRTIFMR